MATYPYRFECDLYKDMEAPKATLPDPLVRVFIGESYTNDSTGEQRVHRQQPVAITVKLSNLEEFLAASINGIPPEWIPSKDPMVVQPINLYREGKRK